MTDFLTKCPHCGHDSAGLQYAIPDAPGGGMDMSQVQAACLLCGVHGPYQPTYREAAEAFQRGEREVVT